MTHTLYHGDCLDILPTLPAQSVDAIIADPPYGTTACKWDSVIPLDAMWRELKRVIKPRGAVVLFAAQPFTSALVMSNAGWFRYSWVWDKVVKTGHLNARQMPLRRHEDIVVFSPASNGGYCYNPHMRKGEYRQKGGTGKNGGVYGSYAVDVKFNDEYYPDSILQLSKGAQTHENLHPTQKPVDLLRYLVRTYTNAGETVLDFTMGSGTCGVACVMEGRNFIGVELDAGYFDIAKRRIEQVQPALMEAAD